MRISDWSSDVCSSDLLVLGGEAGFEDEIEPLEFGEFVQFALGSRTVLDEAADKLVGIDAAAVVEEFDDDLIARLTRRYGEAAVLALARGAALGGGFDTVIERVADDVAQRIAHHLDRFAIKLDIGRSEGNTSELQSQMRHP